MDKVDQEYLDEIVASSGKDSEDKKKGSDVKTKDDGTTIEEILVCSHKKYDQIHKIYK